MQITNLIIYRDETIFQQDGTPFPDNVIIVYEFFSYADGSEVQSDTDAYNADPFAYNIDFINKRLLHAQDLNNKGVPDQLDAQNPPQILLAQIIRNNAARPLIKAIPIPDTSLHLNIKYNTVTASDVSMATNAINSETDILNGIIQGAMDLANSASGPRRKIPTNAVYGLATKAKAIISSATLDFNKKVASSKLILQTNLSAAGPLNRPSSDSIDTNLLNTYKALLKDLFKGLYNAGHIIQPDKNGLAPPPKPSNYEVIDTNFDMIGYGHNITSDENSSGSIYGITGWQKINTTPKQLGISDDQLDTILNRDVTNAYNTVKQMLSANDWKQINTNYANILIILIELTRTNARDYSQFRYMVTEKDSNTGKYKNIGYFLLNSSSFIDSLKLSTRIPYNSYPKNTNANISYNFSEQFMNTVLGNTNAIDTIDNSFTNDKSSRFDGSKYSEIFKSYIYDR